MDYPIPEEKSQILLLSSFSLLITGIITFFNKSYLTSILIFSLFFTSVNFWRNPDYNIHRTLDMTMCKIVALYFIVDTVRFDEWKRTLYHAVLISMIIFNLIETILWIMNNNQWIIFHMALHLYTAYFTIFIYYIL